MSLTRQNGGLGLVALVLMVGGALIVAYSGVTFTTPGRVVNFLGLRIQTLDNHFIPPVVGLAAIVVGLVVLVLGHRNA